MFPTMADWQAASHEEAKGCMMDLCRDKREIQAKLRAADVCASCAPTFQTAIEQGQVSAPVFRHATVNLAMDWKTDEDRLVELIQ